MRTKEIESYITHCITIYNLWLIFMGIKQTKIFFWEKKAKMADFSKWPILKNLLWKFHGLVLGLVELIDAKGIDLA